MFSRRSHHPSEENALTKQHRAARARGVAVLDLTVSNPSSAGLVHEASLLQAFGDPASLYYAPEPQGWMGARMCLSAAYLRRGIAVDSSDLYLTPSTSDAYSYLFKLLCDPGDNVLIPQPSYPLFAHLAAFDNVVLRPYPIRYDGRYYIDLNAVRGARDERTKALLVVHPNNPTGSFVHEHEAAALFSMGLPVISDEVFSSYVLHRDQPHLDSLLRFDQGLCFALDGLSKGAVLPQAKLAWIATSGPAALRSEVRERLGLIMDSYLSTSYVIQHALPRILKAAEPLRDQALARLRENWKTIQQSCSPPSPVSARHVEGGFYGTLQLPRIQSEEAWALHLLQQAEIFVHPGYFYDFMDEGMIVLSLLTPPATLTEGLRRLQQAVSALCEA